MGEQESVLSLACSLIVSCLVTVTLVCLNVCQTFVLSNIFSPLIWLKSSICSLPLALSIFLLVPMLSATSTPCRTRLSILASFLCHPLQGLTFAGTGMLLHYLLPILNPFLEVQTDDACVKVFALIKNEFNQ